MTREPIFAFLALFLTASGLLAQAPCGSINITNGDEIALCLGETVELRQTNDLTNPTYSWSPAAGLIDDPTDPSPRVSPDASRFYRVRATGSDGCSVVDSIFVDVDRLVVPQLIPDTTVCQGFPVPLLASPVTDAGNTVYTLLDNSTTIATSTDPNFTVRLTKDSKFTLIARSENGACEERRTVDISITTGLFDIAEDTLFACLGTDSLTLSVIDTPSVNGQITWRPNRFGDGTPTGNSFNVLPTADITYYAEATINGCARIDSVAVRLDSLPQDLSLTLEEAKDPYCQGDTFFVLSPVYDVGDFPLIEHNWNVAPGLQSPRDLYNAVFEAQDTATLERITTNGSCTDTSRIQVNVVEPPVVSFEPADTIVCPGEPLQIVATFESGSGTLTWTDPTGTLSCTDCLDPIATVQQTTEYMIEVNSGASDCTSELSYTVPVYTDLNPILTDALLLCPGDSRQLIIGAVNPTYTYRITGGGVDSSDPAVLVSPTTTTTYTVATTGECGTSEQNITLVVANEVTVTASGPDAVCANQPLSLSASINPDVSGSYRWTLPSGVTLVGQQVSVDNPVAGTYTVAFTDALGCATTTDSVTVDVVGANLVPFVRISLPDGTLIPNGGTVFSGNDVVLTAEVSNGPEVTFEWSGNYTPATASGSAITVSIPRSDDGQPAPLQYTVTAITGQGGCAFTANVFVNVEQSQVQVPDFFSPDNDGRNDRFRLFYNGSITDYTMIVYDRWGQKVFTSSDPQEGWDGTKDGTPQPADVYLYLAKFRQDGVELQEDGEVTLVR